MVGDFQFLSLWLEGLGCATQCRSPNRAAYSTPRRSRGWEKPVGWVEFWWISWWKLWDFHGFSWILGLFGCGTLFFCCWETFVSDGYHLTVLDLSHLHWQQMLFRSNFLWLSAGIGSSEFALAGTESWQQFSRLFRSSRPERSWWNNRWGIAHTLVVHEFLPIPTKWLLVTDDGINFGDDTDVGFWWMPLQEARFRTTPFRGAVCAETVAKETPGSVSRQSPLDLDLAYVLYRKQCVRNQVRLQVAKFWRMMPIWRYDHTLHIDTCLFNLIYLQDLIIEIHEVQVQKHQTWIIIYDLESTRTGVRVDAFFEPG